MLLVAASPPPPDPVPAWSDAAVLPAVRLSRLLRFGQFPPFKDHTSALAKEDGTHRTLTLAESIPRRKLLFGGIVNTERIGENGSPKMGQGFA
jgi:hypothetical protein